MIKIHCVVERITCQSPETGYSVLKCAVNNYNDLVTVVGNLVDAKYGRQFLAESWERQKEIKNHHIVIFPREKASDGIRLL